MHNPRGVDPGPDRLRPLPTVVAEAERGPARLTFHHGACYRLEPPLPALIASYHPSRQNTQTGRLTEEMLDEVFAQVCRLLDEGKG